MDEPTLGFTTPGGDIQLNRVAAYIFLAALVMIISRLLS